MRIHVGALVVILFVTTFCGPVLSVNLTKKFHLVTTFKANWFRALHHCIANGMRLASILSKEENDEVVKLIKDSAFIEYFWIGGTNLQNESSFYWMGQNKAIGFANWLEGQPNNLEKENCIHIWSQRNYKWNDWLCSSQMYFVCEEDIEQ